jgi:hypothetical protein
MRYYVSSKQVVKRRLDVTPLVEFIFGSISYNQIYWTMKEKENRNEITQSEF